MPTTLGQHSFTRLYTLRDSARLLNVSERTLQRMAADGELRVVRLRGAVRIPALEIERLCREGSEVHAS
jgi:excisionase family DNA binding protein